MNKVYGYIRVSTSTQLDKGYGLESQEKAIKEYCKNNNLELVELFRDQGISGTDPNREGLTDLLASLNGINKVVVLNTSRLWRDDIVKVLVQKELKKSNADVISIENSNYSIYHTDPNDFLINGMFELLDQYERMSISLKLAKGRRTKVKSGVKGSGNTPIGYKWSIKDGKKDVVVDEDTSDIVKLIFDKYIEYRNVNQVVKYLNESGYKTTRGKEFRKQSVFTILKNDFYTGIVRHGNLEQQGNHTPIIDEKTFKKVQRTINRKK